MTNPVAANVLEFWFGKGPLTPEEDRARAKRWFVSDQDFDYDIERRFGKLVSTARAGAFDTWAKEPRSCLALILVLDQFPRNLYRGQASAFASDDKALALSRSLVANGEIDALAPSEQAFALMPYQHAESLDMQNEGIAAYQQQAGKAPAEWREAMNGYAEFAKKHQVIIEQFGRFPHRNESLGRQSTEQEIAYLSDGGSRFGQ